MNNKFHNKIIIIIIIKIIIIGVIVGVVCRCSSGGGIFRGIIRGH
jgi:hypothetical protein